MPNNVLKDFLQPLYHRWPCHGQEQAAICMLTCEILGPVQTGIAWLHDFQGCLQLALHVLHVIKGGLGCHTEPRQPG